MRRIIISRWVLVFYLSLASPVFAASTGAAPPVNSNRIDEDFGYRDTRHIQVPKSDWIESEKAFYGNILKRDTYDILIIPFQVQQYAVDRIDRFLMTSYLAHRIGLDNQVKFPDPALVAKALGEPARTFDENEIYRLANDLKVKVLIKGYVGHNRDERMRLSIVVQTRDQNSSFTPDSRRRQIDRYDIPFDDLDLPSKAFHDRLEDVFRKVGLTLSPAPNRVVYKATRPLPLPTLLDINSGKSISPVMGAYHLQFLGMLYPMRTQAMEHLFERSLVALSRMSPKSSDYPLLKARALFYLRRRPAALAALGTPSTPEEKAFLALLNGHLPDLLKHTSEITSPLHKWMALIESNDLHWSYNQKAFQGIKGEKIDSLTDWKMLIASQLLSRDPWHRQSNLLIKQRLDEAFPTMGLTAEELALKNLPLKDSFVEKKDIRLSVFNHQRSVLNDKKYQTYGPWYPVANDYLDLLCAMAEFNLLKDINYLNYTQGLPESAMEAIEQLEDAYRGHIGMTYLKAHVSKKLARDKKDPVRETLLRQSKEYALNAYLWSQGQTETAKEAYDFLPLGASYPALPASYYYNADYPRRADWRCFEGGDRTVYKNSQFLKVMKSAEPQGIINWEVPLQYTHDDVTKLGGPSRNKEIAKLMEPHLRRFVGHPDYYMFYSERKKIAGEPIDPVKDFEGAVANNPNVWKPYSDMAEYYIEQGNFKKASETFMRYPLFNNNLGNDRVAASNSAFRAAGVFYRVGAIDESIPYFRLAANSNTGAASEMFSSQFLAILEGDYRKALWHSFELIQRYNQVSAYWTPVILLHLSGHHREAWSLLSRLDVQTYNRGIWTASITGLRHEGKSDEEISKWIKRNEFSRADFRELAPSILMAFLADRPPNPQLSAFIKDPDWPAAKRGDQFLRVEKERMGEFAEFYYLVRTGRHDQAWDVGKKNLHFNGASDLYWCAIPYMFWNSSKLGRAAELEGNLKRYNYDLGVDTFQSQLSKACIHGLQKNHTQALGHLKYASWRIPSSGWRPLVGFYQLAELSEWLYDETGQKEYRNLTLEWAKLYQRIYPWYAWAYAMEAKYTESPTDRLRALALTLYLDKYSAHISHFSTEDRNKALQWLKGNNPFLLDLRK